MFLHDDTLREILAAIDPSHIPPAQQASLHGFQAEVHQFLSCHFPVAADLVCPPWAMGSHAKGIATSLDHEIELVLPFRQDRWPTVQCMKTAVLQDLAEHFASNSTEVKEQRFSIGLRRLFGTHTLTVDVLPGMEVSQGAYRFETVDEDQKFLLLHDQLDPAPRLSNLHKHLRLIQGMGNYGDIVRLLKAWRHREGYLIGTCALELMVLTASRDPEAAKAVSLTERLRHVLRFGILFLETDQTLMDISTNQPWMDYLTPNGKAFLAKRWKQLLQALQLSDTRSLRAFLPVYYS